ncbi:P2X receptor D [Hondaea fermentalgiana]|uniref:P2X receptor D n=1 Tax=Hondaea fermentalgiana TaxID=2315210 RepID=A0A2R5H021_9STRA|nr:P2X receptor D [Hondaea fermentalgiana]|eukprot:GBG33654.1 P2X receptor D [Hondaea fermentalgiana]
MVKFALPETLFGKDVDELFAYKTKQMVAIKDRRLGLLNYVFLIATMIYVLLYQILYNTGYLNVMAPYGEHRFSLRSLTNSIGCDPIDDLGCYTVFPAVQNTSYCSQTPDDTSIGCAADEYLTSKDDTCVRKRNCSLADELDVGVIEGGELLLTTRIFEVAQVNNCPASSDNSVSCDTLWENLNETSDSFVAGVEDFTLLVDHAVQASTDSSIADVSRSMKGVLSIPNNGALCKKLADDGRVVRNSNGDNTESAPCFVDSNLPAADNYDVFDMASWLGAADLDIDQPSGSKPNESVRARGHIVTFTIDYTNIHPWSGASDEISYVISVKYLPDSSYKVTTSTDVVNINSTIAMSRRIQKRYGIKVIVQQTGRLGAFSFNTLLLQLAAGSALFGVSVLLTDFLALNVMPNKEQYRAAKIQVTEDFGDLRKEQKRQRRAGEQDLTDPTAAKNAAVNADDATSMHAINTA